MRPTDKGKRNEITARKWKQRLTHLNIGSNAHIFKHQGKPCSCDMCSPRDEKTKYKVKYKHQLLNQ